MKLIHSVKQMREWSQNIHSQNETIALVGTLGNLHLGHLTLTKNAKKYASRTVVSIFVNPTQFGANEDFSTYPRTLAEDLQKLESCHVDAVFVPETTEIYPGGLQESTHVSVPELSDILCGKSRPQLFYGVTTVVNKLFNIIQADVAIFGEKDYQQVLVIKKMVADLFMPVEIISMPTVREHDNLALSSRNQYLTGEQRIIAPRLYQTLCQLRDCIIKNPANKSADIYQAISDLHDHGFKVDYIEVRRMADLLPASVMERDLIVLAAAYLGKARLIDNIKFSIPV